MTDTVTISPGPAVTELHTYSLVADLCGLLWEASELPRPSSVSVYGATDHITLQFEPDPSSEAAIAQWAAKFGGTVTHRPVWHEGHPCMICRTEFTTHGVEITAFALIRTSEGDGTDE
jgi:hypothetical protein